MPVLRINNYFDAYRLRAQAEDLHELAARPDKKAVTEFVNRQIMEMIELQPEDSLVDIGCGDGSLPRMAAGRCTNAIGIVSTEEEQRRLAAEFPALSIKAGDVQSLPLASQSASKVVCNATLLYLQSESEVQAALCEIARIARPGATVLVGEIPKIDEYAHYGIYRGTSMLGFLGHVWRRNGLRSFLGMIRRWMKAVVGNEQIVLNSAGIFYSSPETMVALAESAGLRLTKYFRHKELDGQNNVVDSEFRYDYLFTV